MLGNDHENPGVGFATCSTEGAPAGLATRTPPGGWRAPALRAGRTAGASTSCSSPAGSLTPRSASSTTRSTSRCTFADALRGPAQAQMELPRVNTGVAGSLPGEAWSRLRGSGTCTTICDPRAPPGVGLAPGGVPTGARDFSPLAAELSAVSLASSSSSTQARFPGPPVSGDLQAHGGDQDGRGRKR